MKHNYVKILSLDFKILSLCSKVEKLANIFINDCQIYNLFIIIKVTNEIYETLVCYFVLQ